MEDKNFEYFNVTLNSSLKKLINNYNSIINEIEDSNLNRRNKNYLLFFIKEKYNYVHDTLKEHHNDDSLFWENLDNC